MAKGICAPRLPHTTAQAATSMDTAHVDTAGPYHKSLGGSRYIVIFVDSIFRLQRPDESLEKSTSSAIFGVVKHFIADMGVPRVARTDHGTEYTNLTFVCHCNGLRICRELTTP